MSNSNELAMQTIHRHLLIAPQTITADTTVFVYRNAFDTAGMCDSVTFDIILGATDGALSALKIQESDTLSSATALDTPSDIVVFGTTTGATLPSATNDNTVCSVTIPWRAGRKRYCHVAATTGDVTAGTFLCVMAYATRKIETAGAASAGAAATVAQSEASPTGLREQLIVAG